MYISRLSWCRRHIAMHKSYQFNTVQIDGNERIGDSAILVRAESHADAPLARVNIERTPI